MIHERADLVRNRHEPGIRIAGDGEYDLIEKVHLTTF